MVSNFGEVSRNNTMLNASNKGYINSVKLMLSLGADDLDGAMIEASKGGHMHIVKLLIKKGATNYNKAMIAAAEKGHIDIVKFMIKKGATNYNKAMMEASNKGHIDIVKLMIEKGVTDYDNSLTEAVDGGHIDIVKFMIEKGATNYGFSIMAAAKKGYIDIVKLILEKDTERLPAFYNAALNESIDEGHYDIANLLSAEMATYGSISKGGTSLHYVKNLDTLNKLINHNIHAIDENGNTPLHTALLDGRIDIAKALMYIGANVNIKNKQNMTPKMIIKETEKDIEKMNGLIYHAHGKLLPDIFVVPKNITIQFAGTCFGVLKFRSKIDYKPYIENVSHTFKSASLCLNVSLSNPTDPTNLTPGLQTISPNKQIVHELTSERVKNIILGANTDYPTNLRDLITMLQKSYVLQNRKIRLILFACLGVDDISQYMCGKLLNPKKHDGILYINAYHKDGMVLERIKSNLCPVDMMQALNAKKSITDDDFDNLMKNCIPFREEDGWEQKVIQYGRLDYNPVELYEEFDFIAFSKFILKRDVKNKQQWYELFIDGIREYLNNNKPIMMKYPYPCILLLLDSARRSKNFEKTLKHYINDKFMSEYLIQFL